MVCDNAEMSARCRSWRDRRIKMHANRESVWILDSDVMGQILLRHLSCSRSAVIGRIDGSRLVWGSGRRNEYLMRKAGAAAERPECETKEKKRTILKNSLEASLAGVIRPRSERRLCGGWLWLLWVSDGSCPTYTWESFRIQQELPCHELPPLRFPLSRWRSSA